MTSQYQRKYPTNISKEETNAGYEIEKIWDVDTANYGSPIPGMEPEKVEAICKRISDDERIVKVNSPAGGYFYRHEHKIGKDWKNANTCCTRNQLPKKCNTTGNLL